MIRVYAAFTVFVFSMICSGPANAQLGDFLKKQAEEIVRDQTEHEKDDQQENTENGSPANDSTTKPGISRLSNPDLYGVTLGINSDQAIAILQQRVPGLAILNSRIGEGSSKSDARLYVDRNYCVEYQKAAKACVSALHMSRELGEYDISKRTTKERHSIRTEMIEQFAESPGNSIVLGVTFMHVYDPELKKVDALAAAIKKFGNPHEKKEGGKSGRTWLVSATWYVDTPLGLGVIELDPNVNQASGGNAYTLRLGLDSSIVTELKNAQSIAYEAARRESDVAF